jgi:hypothetical protein
MCEVYLGVVSYIIMSITVFISVSAFQHFSISKVLSSKHQELDSIVIDNQRIGDEGPVKVSAGKRWYTRTIAVPVQASQPY